MSINIQQPWLQRTGSDITTRVPATDNVIIGATAPVGAERLRVAGDSVFGGHIGVASGLVQASTALELAESVAFNGVLTGIRVRMTNTDGTGSDVRAITGLATSSGASPLAIGGQFIATVDTASIVGADDWIGIDAQITTGFTHAGAINDGFGIRVQAPSYGTAVRPFEMFGVRIDDQGSVGVTLSVGLDIARQTGSTTFLGARLDAPMRITDDVQLRFGTTDDATVEWLNGSADWLFENNNALGMTIFRLGTATAITDWQIQDSANALLFRVDGTGLVNVPGLGASLDVQTDGSSNLITVSDERRKRIHGPVEYGLEEVMQLHPVLFNYDTDPEESRSNIGFTAQDVAAVIPEAVGLTGDGEHLGLNSRGILAALVNAVKEQQQQIEALQAALELAS